MMPRRMRPRLAEPPFRQRMKLGLVLLTYDRPRSRNLG